MQTAEAKSTQKQLKVLLVEDHPIVRHGISALIEDEPDLTVCGEAESMQQTIPLVREQHPDIVVVDIALKDGSGLDLIKQIREIDRKVPILVLSMHDEAVYAERALRAGAKGYIMKKEAMDKFLTALRRVLGGELYVSEHMSARLLNKLIDPDSADGGAPRLDALSDREFEVFRLIADGIGPSEIAQRLSVSVKTIETHREHIKEKLGLKSGTELTRFSLQWAMEHR